MTALAGLWYTDGCPARDPLDRMLAAQRLYGPDHMAAWSESNVAMGRQLKRILPEDRFDTQPLISRDGRFTLVADAFLDNRDDLAAALVLDSRAAEMSDAAFVLAAFERWGLNCFDHLYGSYAFAVWDRAEPRWILARDALGGKPLHYHRSDRCFAFASMPKGLHALPEIPYEPDTDTLARTLDLLPTDPRSSSFRHIARIGMGEYAVVTSAGITHHHHWNPSPALLELPRAADYHARLRAELDRAVAVRLRGAGDVGAQLSGGIDSSAVTATAARLLSGTDRRVIAFTAVPVPGFDGIAPSGRIIDEGPLAAETAALHPNIDHVLVHTQGRSPLDGLDRAFHLYEQPVPNPCNAVWSDHIADLARARGLTVMLTGQMGNLTLSYDGARLLPALLRRGRFLRLAREAYALRRAGSSVAGVVAQIIGPAPTRRIRGWFRRSDPADPLDATLLNPALRTDLGLPQFRPPANRGADSHADRLAALRHVDPANYAKGILAHWGIDQRDPTADRRFVEFCLSVPEDQYFRDGQSAALARHSLADRLPAAVVQSRSKGLQAADWHLGMAAAPDLLAAELARLDACADTRTLLDLPRLRQMIEDWPAQGWEQPRITTRYRLGLLRALASGHFLRRATRSNE
ncbi:asparagine synthase-related protein [Sphingomonas sp. ZT3P38]|uniref:asparagine synthetase B family protein n=1 Tax=Parasphingomonas zepuensis TaxID=3096161 RepID=UPI002FCB169E